MWQKIMRDMEWLVIVALLVGAVMAVGCGNSAVLDPVTDPKIVAPDKITFLGSDSTIYGMYKDEFDSPVEGGTWTFDSSNNGTTPTHTTGTFNSTAGGLPLTISFTQAGIYQFKFAKSNLEKTVKVYVYPTAGPSKSVEIGSVATIGGGMIPQDPLHTITVGCAELGIGAQNPIDPISFIPTKEGVFNVRYAVWASSGVLGEETPLLADVIAVITVTVPVSPPAGIVVSAGSVRVAAIGEVVTLNGTAQNGSTFSQGTWVPFGDTTGSTATQLPYDSVNNVTPLTFSATQAGVYQFKFTDGTYNSVTKVHVYPPADAGSNRDAARGSIVSLVGNSDINVTGLPTIWTPPAGVTLNNADKTTATFTATTEGSYQFMFGFYPPSGSTTPLTSATVTINVVAPPPGTISTIAELQAELFIQPYIVEIPASTIYPSKSLEILTFNNNYTMLNLTSGESGYGIIPMPSTIWENDWLVEDVGFPRLQNPRLSFQQAPRIRYLNTSAPVNSADSLKMPGYTSLYGDIPAVDDNWLKVAKLQSADLAGKTFSYYPYSYKFNADNTGVYTDAYGNPNMTPKNVNFTWAIDPTGFKAVLTFDPNAFDFNVSKEEFYFTIRGAAYSVQREIAITKYDKHSNFSSCSLKTWSLY